MRRAEEKIRRGVSVFFCDLCILCSAVWLSGCAPPARMVPGLVDRFRVVSLGNASAAFERTYPVVRNGWRRDAMVLVAPVAIRADIAGLSGQVALKFLAAPVFNIGDGFQFDVVLGTGQGEKKVFGRYFDPGRRPEDRAWIPLEVPLNLNGAMYLELRVSAGPQGDLVDDWLALAELGIDEPPER